MQYRPLAICTALLLILIIIHLSNPKLLPDLYGIAYNFDIESLANQLRSYGSWMIIASIIGNTLVNILGLPTVIFAGANALIFGFWGGVVVSWIAEVLGAAISFLLCRTLFYKSSRKFMEKRPKLQFLDRISDIEAFRALFVARLIPLSPSGLLNVIAALSPISFPNFISATALGKLPSIIFEVVVGQDLLTFEDNKIRVVFWIVLALALFAYNLVRQRQKNA